MKLSDHIKSLSLKKGDILVVTRKYSGATLTWMEHISQAGRLAGIDFEVPILVVDDLDDIQIRRETNG